MNTAKRFYKHIVVLILSLLISDYAVDLFFQNQKNKYLNSQTELLTASYETQYRYFKIMSADIYTMYQDKQELISAFAQAKDANSSKQAIIRDDMYQMLNKRYKRLVNMGVKQLHFHLPNNRSFLRMHKPEKFGDDLSSTRESIVYVNRTKKPTENFEVGKLIHGFRFVYPLFDESKKYIGTMEVSFSSNILLNNITDKFVMDKHFLVLKSEVDKNIWSEYVGGLYEDSLESSDYMVLKEQHSQKYDDEIKDTLSDSVLLDTVTSKMQEGIYFSIAGKYNYNSIAITFIPIKNILQDKVVAYLALYFESDYIDTINSDNDYTKILIMSMIVMMFLFSLYATITQGKLREMAHFDKLTQLPNRAYFYIGLTQEIKRAKRLQKRLSVMFIDLDGFKKINDTYGHNVGDKLLIRVARRLEKSVRGVDVVGRIGGDEFTILITDVRDDHNSLLVAEKIINAINEDYVINHNVVNIGASIGIANFPEHGEDLETLINNADNAMYEAKVGGKNRFIMHEDKN